jgi:Cu-processing system permease protein
MFEFLKSAVLLGLRGRAVLSIVVLGFSLLGASYVAADFSPRQPQAVALDVGLSFLRFSLVLLAISWIQDLVGKEFERKTVLFSFAYPTGRHAYIVGRYMGVLVLLAVATVVMGGFLAWVVSMSAHDYVQTQPVVLGTTFVVTLAGVYLDVAVVAAFALCIASLSTVTLLPLALGGMFAIAGRSLGPVMDYLRQGAEGDTELVTNFSPILDLIQWLIPDLSRLDWRVWPMYQMPIADEAIAWSVVMALAYIGLMLALAVAAAGRRELT